MGVNPGDESKSVHAWQQRYKELHSQFETLQSQYNDKKTALQQLQVKYEEVSRQLREREEELSSTVEELKVTSNLMENKKKKIERMKMSADQKRIERLERKNEELKKTIEELQARIARVGGVPAGNDSLQSKITTALIPMMLKQYDPEIHDYKDAFVNLVERVIEDGDTMTKIVAILIKYGGNGPKDKVRELVNSDQFDTAIETLVDSGIILDTGVEIRISDKETENIETIDTMETPDLFENMIQLTQSLSDEAMVSALMEFRDTLQSREVPLTTIFFEIRKMIERIQKGKVERKDIRHQIRLWKEKYDSLS